VTGAFVTERERLARRAICAVGALLGLFFLAAESQAQVPSATSRGDISTIVQNAVTGRPAAGMVVELFDIAGVTPRRISRETTTAGGRTTLLTGPLPPGRYELRFALADYFHKEGVAVGDPPFLDFVPIRFSIDAPTGHYHLPLICSPWGYSMYRGS
jgi:hydroxyisourate hydrolase